MILLGIIFVVTIILGVPIAFSLGLCSTVFLLLDPNFPILVIPHRMFNGMNSFPLLAVPFFILAGELMVPSGILPSLIRFATALVGKIRGGLAHVVILVSMIFAGVTGAAVAEAAALSKIMIPTMEADGYDKDFSSAVVAASAVMGPIIPPSIAMVIYALAAGGSVSIGGLFLAGVIPGVLIGLGMMVMVYYICYKKRAHKKEGRADFREIFVSLKGAYLALIMPVIILGGILSGVFTATESAAVASVYAFIVGFFVTRQLKLKDLPQIMVNTGIVTSVVMLLMATCSITTWLLTVYQLPGKISSLIFSISHSPMVFFMLVMALLMIVGCLLESIAALVMLVPIFAPIAAQFGINPLHFGFAFVMNLMIGLITPPVGVVLFTVCGIVNISLERLVKSVWPFVIWQFIVLLLVVFLPDVAMFIPRLFGIR